MGNQTIQLVTCPSEPVEKSSKFLLHSGPSAAFALPFLIAASRRCSQGKHHLREVFIAPGGIFDCLLMQRLACWQVEVTLKSGVLLRFFRP
jgi:hypothetical protein